MKYQNKITELGIQRTQLSKSVLGDIKDLETMMQEANELEEQINQTDDSDEEYDEMVSNLEEIKGVIAEEDENLAVKIAEYWAKKPEYDAKMQQMRQAGQGKKAAAPAPKVTAPVVQPTPTPSGEEKKEDGDNWLLWGVLGGLGLLVGVNLFKNR
jgi:outer membrane biosynthesis protein TonB